MKTLKIMKWMAVAVVLLSSPSYAGWVYQFPDGANVGYWDDAERWTDNSGTHAVPTGADAHCNQPGTIYVTNAVPYVWTFCLKAPIAGDPLILHFLEGATTRYPDSSGNLSDGWTKIEIGAAKDTYGIVQIDAGATFAGGLQVGTYGYGVVTNQGLIRYQNECYLGMKAGSTGRLVCCDGGEMQARYQKDLYVGQQGRGELVVTNATFSWSYYTTKNGDVVVGESSAGGEITVEEGGVFKDSFTYLGGRDAGKAGVGELVLRGGEVLNNYENGNGVCNLFLGMCPTEDGGVDAASRGVIRGYGRFITNAHWKRGNRGIRLAMGYGEIVGDGEGDESRVLNLIYDTAFYSVSNALPADVAAETTSGWRAVNKGLVMMPGASCEWTGETFNNLVAYPGCAKEKGVVTDLSELQLPDLVNAVRIRATGTKPGENKTLAASVIAPDRTDAYTNALPAGCNVLSVHKMGVFSGSHLRTAESSSRFESANVAIRYDQTKIQKDNTRLQLWRYVAADGKWHRLVSLDPGERPSSKVIAMADDATLTKLDEIYNLGTFAVVERTRVGTAIIIR